VRSQELASTLDLLPTWLAWAGVPLPSYSLFGPVTYTGRSLLPFITGAAAEGGVDGDDEAAAFPAPRHRLLMSAAEAASATHPLRDGAAPAPLGTNATRIHGSFQNHEAQEYYPMRSVVAADASSGAHYRLIYNIAERLLYPIASDLYAAPAFQDLLNRTRNGGALRTPREREREGERAPPSPLQSPRRPQLTLAASRLPLTAQLRRTGTVTSPRIWASRARPSSSSTLRRTRWS
jgi:hypothetical protein